MAEKLSGLPIYRREEGYIAATRYEIDDKNNIVEKVSTIDREGHEHKVNEQPISRGREKHILELHREQLKMVEKHQKLTEDHLVELNKRKEDLAQQKLAMEADVKVLEERTTKNTG